MEYWKYLKFSEMSSRGSHGFQWRPWRDSSASLPLGISCSGTLWSVCEWHYELSDYRWYSVVVTINELVIFSYDLKNETYHYLSLPGGLTEVPPDEPELGVLKGCLCISHDHRRTHFVVWIMREFGLSCWMQVMSIFRLPNLICCLD